MTRPAGRSSGPGETRLAPAPRPRQVVTGPSELRGVASVEDARPALAAVGRLFPELMHDTAGHRLPDDAILDRPASRRAPGTAEGHLRVLELSLEEQD